MVYTEKQVFDIIKSITDESPKSILEKWINKDSNILLDLDKTKYPLYVYTFPIILDEKEVATMTLVEFYNTGYDNMRQDLMIKYLGYSAYEITHHSYINDNTYLEGYLTINEKFQLPEIVKGFYAYESSFRDKDGQDIKYRISYGCPSNDSETYIYSKYISDDKFYNTYRFDNDVNIQIENRKIEGNILGEEINNNIKKRIK